MVWEKRGIDICEDINQEKLVWWLRPLMSFFAQEMAAPAANTHMDVTSPWYVYSYVFHTTRGPKLMWIIYIYKYIYILYIYIYTCVCVVSVIIWFGWWSRCMVLNVVSLLNKCIYYRDITLNILQREHNPNQTIIKILFRFIIIGNMAIKA